MILTAAAVGVVAILPGAVLFRLPVLDRARRASLPAEERLFWQIVISLAWSIAVVLALAALGAYRFDRLVVANLSLVIVAVALARGRLWYAGGAARVSATALVPLALVGLAAARFFPSSEYIIGGKDPGGYVNQGVLISTRGSLVVREPEVAALTLPTRTLFFNSHEREEYFDNRFMGFFLQDPDTGQVVGQMPHLFPASIAIAYDLGGVRGGLSTVGLWAVLGVLAVYFVGARILGRPAAFAASVLLPLNLIEVWFARYPNAEVVIQALLFAALLALARAHQDGDPFFSPVAGVLGGLLIFTHIQALLALSAIGAAVALAWIVDGRRMRLAFLAPLAAGAVLGWVYWSGPMRASFWRPLTYLRNLPGGAVTAAIVIGLAALGLALWLRRSGASRVRAAIPVGLSAALAVLAVYAWWLRAPGGKLTDWDAAALRTFVDVYALPLGMIAALAGLITVVPRRFWRDPAFVLTGAAFAVFLFYKLQVVPEHLWLARRFLPVILPSTLLLAAAAALGTWDQRPRGPQVVRAILGAIVLIVLGQQYRIQAAPVVPHVEFKGVVAHVDDLARRFTDRDLVIVESRDASDVHVLAVPLAYMHGRRVLWLENAVPDKALFEAFLADALRRYDRVFFLGGGGTDLISPAVRATPVTYVQLHAPSFLVTPWNDYRAGIRPYKFDYSLYRLERGPTTSGGFALDIGFEDDLSVVRFGDKEMTDGRTFRWTSPQSFVSVRGLTGREREIALVMHDGGRPAAAAPASVEVFLGEVPLGRIAVGSGFREYVRPVTPAALQAALAAPGRQIRLVSSTWKPSAYDDSPDRRDLGVMVDRVEIR